MIPWAMNPYYRIYDAVIAVGAGAVATVEVAEDLEVGDIMLGAALNVDVATTGAGGATKVGIGTAADPDKYGKTAALTLDSKSPGQLFNPTTVLSAAEDLILTAVDNDGAALGTIQNGSVRVRLEYLRMSDLPDA